MNLFVQRYEEMGEHISFVSIPKAIHVNTKKISPEKLKERLEKKRVELENIPFVQHGFFVKKSPFNLVSSPEYLLGLFYIQDAAAQIPAEILAPKKIVLDACAGVGGKTMQLAESCIVIAVERDEEQFIALENNMERIGIENCIAYQMDFRAVKKSFPFILLDAPCSGNYMLEEQWLKRQSIARIQERAQLQKDIIAHSLSILEKGGVLVYCTCSLEPEENEEVVQFALDNFPVHLEDIHTIGDPGLTSFFGKNVHTSMKKCRRLWPHKTNTTGFFIAKLRK